jgi:glutathionyl-hydroquinone reductase
VRTRHLQLVTHEHSVTIKTRSNASSPYGPVKAGLTTSPTTHEARLTELLNSLENVVEDLNFKSFTVYDTLTIAMENLRVALSNIATEEDGTDTI